MNPIKKLVAGATVAIALAGGAIMVVPGPPAMYVEPGFSEVAQGCKIALTALDKQGRVLKRPIWISTRPDIAVIEGDSIRGVQPGVAQILAKSPAYEASAVVEVTANSRLDTPGEDLILHVCGPELGWLRYDSTLSRNVLAIPVGDTARLFVRRTWSDPVVEAVPVPAPPPGKKSGSLAVLSAKLP